MTFWSFIQSFTALPAPLTIFDRALIQREAHHAGGSGNFYVFFVLKSLFGLDRTLLLMTTPLRQYASIILTDGRLHFSLRTYYKGKAHEFPYGLDSWSFPAPQNVPTVLPVLDIT